MASNPASTNPLEIQGVLFDLDDTLYDRAAAFRAWATDLVAATLPAAEISAREDVVAFLIDADDSGYRPRSVFVDRVYARFPSVSGPTVDDFVSAFRAGMLTKMTIDEGSVLLTDALSASKIPWGIVTNGETFFQQRKIDHLGLSAPATCVVISEAFGAKKPHPGIFLAAARELGVEAGNILFVGDHVVNDISGAQGAGMQTAWLRRGREWPRDGATAAPPDFAVDDLRELVSVTTPPPDGDK